MKIKSYSSQQKDGSGESPQPTVTPLDNTGTSVCFSDIKMIISGSQFEVYKYQVPIRLGAKPQKSKKTILKKDRAREYKEQNARKGYARIMRLAYTNFSQDKNSKMLTLTFRDTDKFDIRSIKQCNDRFRRFITKVREEYGDIKFIRSIEFQDKYKRGAIHFHLLISIPFTSKERLSQLWTYGFADLRKTKRRRLGSYLSKYFTKSSLSDARFLDHRKFSSSKNMKEPTVFYQGYADYVLDLIEEKKIKPEYSKSYDSEHNGQVNYFSYNIPNPRQTLLDNSSAQDNTK